MLNRALGSGEACIVRLLLNLLSQVWLRPTGQHVGTVGSSGHLWGIPWGKAGLCLPLECPSLQGKKAAPGAWDTLFGLAALQVKEG